MNNTFDFNRFGKVVSLDVKRYVSQFGLTFLILCAMPIVLWLLSLVFSFTMPCMVRVWVAMMTVWLSAILVPAKAFGHINLQREGVGFAMLPASNLEKFLSIALLCILTPIAVMACSYGIDSLLTLLPFGGFKNFISGGVLQTMKDFLIDIDAVGEAAVTAGAEVWTVSASWGSALSLLSPVIHANMPATISRTIISVRNKLNLCLLIKSQSFAC